MLTRARNNPLVLGSARACRPPPTRTWSPNSLQASGKSAHPILGSQCNSNTDNNPSFVATFGLHNRKVYITGESYAGMYVPYIANYFLEQNDTTNFDVNGIMIYDPSKNSIALRCSKGVY